MGHIKLEEDENRPMRRPKYRTKKGCLQENGFLFIRKRQQFEKQYRENVVT